MCRKTCFYVRDGALVGDLKDAISPMVWRLDLSRIHAAGFRVVQNGTQWDLTIEGPTGGPTIIASYESAALANRALRRLSCGLRRSGSSRLGSLFRWFLGIVFFLLLAYGLLQLVGILFSPGSVGVSQPQGQPMSADQVLRAPR